ncbi:hypothetical protein lbkm_2085 [Lachnospiraceae bacterium KM106-2]|nr:hypothetical protein lbkm_2085 [Lachnospiraceae bacterium KM106-2]
MSRIVKGGSSTFLLDSNSITRHLKTCMINYLLLRKRDDIMYSPLFINIFHFIRIGLGITAIFAIIKLYQVKYRKIQFSKLTKRVLIAVVLITCIVTFFHYSFYYSKVTISHVFYKEQQGHKNYLYIEDDHHLLRLEYNAPFTYSSINTHKKYEIIYSYRPSIQKGYIYSLNPYNYN